MALTRLNDGDTTAGQIVTISGQQVAIPAVMMVDSTGAENPSGGTAIAGTSGNVANASAAATLAAGGAGTTNYVTGVDFTFAGATAASVVVATITGLLGGTQSYAIAVPAGVAVGGTPLSLVFKPPHPASAANTAITATLPALGAGNTNAVANIRGIRK